MHKCVVIDINTAHLGVDPEQDINDAIKVEISNGFRFESMKIDSNASAAYLIFTDSAK